MPRGSPSADEARRETGRFRRALTVKCSLYYNQYKMYCTISVGAASTGLADDAIRSYARLRSMARALGTVSGSMSALSNDVTSAYFAALTNSAPSVWAALVAASVALTRYVASFDGIIVLDQRQSEALLFFEAIVRENEDLLVVELLPAHDRVLP